MRLKVEINTREHFSVLGFQQMNYKVEYSWFTVKCTLTTYQLEELFETKLRVLYQRRKSCDLFDIFWAYQHHKMNTPNILKCYEAYMKLVVEDMPSQKEFLFNMEAKMKDKDFTNDIHIVL